MYNFSIKKIQKLLYTFKTKVNLLTTEQGGAMETGKITKFGGSLGIIFDKSITTKMLCWEEGTPVELDYDITNKRIVIIEQTTEAIDGKPIQR